LSFKGELWNEATYFQHSRIRLKETNNGVKGDFIKLGDCWKVIYINKVGY